MTTSSVSPRSWEVWLAYLRFADHPEKGKVRPIVVIDGLAAARVVAKVTSAVPQPQFLYCELMDWEEEGLERPSRVQIAPLFSIGEDDLLNGEPLGILSPRDQRAVADALAACSDSEE